VKIAADRNQLGDKTLSGLAFPSTLFCAATVEARRSKREGVQREGEKDFSRCQLDPLPQGWPAVVKHLW
jgi:hypothetical protein